MTPTHDYRQIAHEPPSKPHAGLDGQVNRLLGWHARRGAALRGLEEEVGKVERFAAEFSTFSDHLLRHRLLELRTLFRRGGRMTEPVLHEALALVREVADRQVGLRPYPVQLVGALALHRGFLAEMATGEGKTLTAGLAAVLAGWTKRPCHIITVNDYLVRRDEEWIKPIYQFCGVSVGYVTADMKPDQRRREYAMDVTYTTSKEVLADFLRDRLQLGGLNHPTRRLIRKMASPQFGAREQLVMRGLHTAIVDEADSILIDEAVTPLIISTPHKNEDLREASVVASQIVGELVPDQDYQVDARHREVNLTDRGMDRLKERCEGYSGLWRGNDRRVDIIRQALTAREFFLKGRQYILNDGKVVIVDEFTGRPMPQRSWRQGLHQAIEAKEGLSPSDPTETVARLSFQRFFRLYTRLSGMTGTAWEAADEFWRVYKLPVIRIPTNRPCVRQQWPDRVFQGEEEKFAAIAEEVERVHRAGRPVLIGTRNVAASERVADLLAARGLSFHLLNASHLVEEAQIVAQAGQPGQITVSTNMAGRGTDIRLGKGVAASGGLHVVATERHESGRVDRQLFGRSGRQGDPGTAQAFVSMEDELLRRHLPRFVFNRAKPWAAGPLFSLAQSKAQRQAFKQRREVLRMDDWIEEALSFAGPPLA